MQHLYLLRFLLSIAFICGLTSAPWIGSLSAQNLKVFILAGQSNAQGHDEVYPDTIAGTLSSFMLTDEADRFDHIQNDDVTFTTRDDVWVRYMYEDGYLIADSLKIGLGASTEQVDPEFGLAQLLGDYYDEQVLIIKTCWGGKSLAVDFRPPSKY